MKFYLAHPILLKNSIRQQELVFEKATGIQLINPFYDIERDDIRSIDEGQRQAWEGTLDYRLIVERDIKHIIDCDGLVAVIPFDIPTIGTIMETLIAKQLSKKVYVITNQKRWRNHPWPKYFTDEIFLSFSEFEAIVKKCS